MARKSARKPGAASAHDLVRSAIDGLVASTRVAADRVVRERGDETAVHDLRVGLRRLRTVLRSARRLYGRAHIRALEQRFKAIANATNALRDEEVLHDTVVAADAGDAAQAGVDAWLRARAAREVALRGETAVLLGGGDIGDACAALSAVVARGPKRDMTLSRFTKACLKKARRGVRRVLPVARHDTERLHVLRIRFKRLRYTAEMLGRFMTESDAADALRAESWSGRGRLGPMARAPRGPNYAAVALLAAQMQDTLGLLHDADRALTIVSDTAGLDPASRLALAFALSQLRERMADAAVAKLEQLPDELFGRTVK